MGDGEYLHERREVEDSLFLAISVRPWRRREKRPRTTLRYHHRLIGSTPILWWQRAKVFNRRYVTMPPTPPYGYYWPVQSGGRCKDPSRQELISSSTISHMVLSWFPMEVWYSILRHYHETATLLQHLIMSWFNIYCVIVKLKLLLVGLLPT